MSELANAPTINGARCDMSVNSISSSETHLEETVDDLMPPEMIEQVKRVVPQDVSLLLTGETGTGKTRLARLIHDLSPRCAEPFFIVDCGSLAASLIESELFGHVKGAFTGAERQRSGKFAAVGRGTLVLDEINSLPLTVQSKLLRAVDERVFEAVGSNKSDALQARIIAISNAPLEHEVSNGRFRADLFFRINVVGFCLAPLRERPRAIARLARQFMNEFAARNRPDVSDIAFEAVQALERHTWPGNLRELRNVLERAVALCHGPKVQFFDLPEEIRFGSAAPTGINRPDRPSEPPTPWQSSIDRDEAEISRIKSALEKHRNNRSHAANELGIGRMGLYKKLQKYGLLDKRA